MKAVDTSCAPLALIVTTAPVESLLTLTCGVNEPEPFSNVTANALLTLWVSGLRLLLAPPQEATHAAHQSAQRTSTARFMFTTFSNDLS
jgi:hypothetical protein